MGQSFSSIELPGLEVVLDRLDYACGGPQVPPETPHVFVYHLTIRNNSDRRVIFLGRKWVVLDSDGNRRIIEGDGIVGQTPELAVGDTFSYHSFHLTAGDAQATGSFHGLDADERHIHVRIPTIAMRVPVSGN